LRCSGGDAFAACGGGRVDDGCNDICLNRDSEIANFGIVQFLKVS